MLLGEKSLPHVTYGAVFAHATILFVCPDLLRWIDAYIPRHLQAQLVMAEREDESQVIETSVHLSV